MYIIKGETDHQPRLDAWDKCSGLVHWEDPEGGRWEGGSGWGIHVTPWLIHVNVWQKPLQYYKVISLQLIKINEKKKGKKKPNCFLPSSFGGQSPVHREASQEYQMFLHSPSTLLLVWDCEELSNYPCPRSRTMVQKFGPEETRDIKQKAWKSPQMN